MKAKSELSQQAQRKNEHLALAEKFYRTAQGNGNVDFQEVRLIHPELPETALSEIKLQQQLFGKTIAAPIYINAITAGTPKANAINQKLARLAAHFSLPMTTGSLSILRRDPKQAIELQKLRALDPQGVILANLGASYEPDFAAEIIDDLAADGLQIHLNAAQEFAMPEGDADFHWRQSLKRTINEIGPQTPIIAKEVGFGMGPASIKSLLILGIAGIDLSGASSTNFIAIENERRSQRLISDFSDFGLSTIESLLARLKIVQEQQTFPATTFASGGIRTPWQAVKALSLGADLVGMSTYFLHLALHQSLDDMIQSFNAWLAEFKGILNVFGCQTPAELRNLPLILSPRLLSFTSQLDLNWSRFAQKRI